MAHEIDRLFATPTMRPCLPERSDMVAACVDAIGLLGSLASVRTVPLHHAGTAAATALALAASWPADIAVGAVALEMMTARLTAALMARTEAIRTSAGLADGELGNRPRRRLLAFGTRQRRANQAAVNRSFVLV